MPADTDYSLKEVFDEFRTEVRGDLGRIEGKVDSTAKDVADLRVEGAKQATKSALLMALIMFVVGALASVGGGVITANILSGAK